MLLPMRIVYWHAMMVLLLASPVVSLGTFQPTLVVSGSEKNFSSHPLPFDGFFLRYHLKARIGGIPIPVVNYTVAYVEQIVVPASSPSYPSNTSYNYRVDIIIQSTTLTNLGVSQENATFLENSSTREMHLNSTEGTIIAWLLGLIYNSTAQNWTPYWVNPAEVQGLPDSMAYPIYAYQMNLSQRSELGQEELGLFNESRPVVSFKTTQEENRSGTLLDHNIALVYDQTSGMLVRGRLETNMTESATTSYSLDFELKETNGFSVFATNTTNTSGNLLSDLGEVPPLNYFLLAGAILAPALYIFARFRFREIDGGAD